MHEEELLKIEKTDRGQITTEMLDNIGVLADTLENINFLMGVWEKEYAFCKEPTLKELIEDGKGTSKGRGSGNSFKWLHGYGHIKKLMEMLDGYLIQSIDLVNKIQET